MKLHTFFTHFLLSYSAQTPVEELGLPQIVPTAEDEVGPGVEGRAHPAQAAVTAGTLQTVLVPVPVQGLQHEAVPDLPIAAGTAPRLLSGLEGHERHTWQRKVSEKRQRQTHTLTTDVKVLSHITSQESQVSSLLNIADPKVI